LEQLYIYQDFYRKLGQSRMAKTIKKETSDKNKDSISETKKLWGISKQYKIVYGSILVLFSIALLLAFISFYIYGQEDQSAVTQLANRNETV